MIQNSYHLIIQISFSRLLLTKRENENKSRRETSYTVKSAGGTTEDESTVKSAGGTTEDESVEEGTVNYNFRPKGPVTVIIRL